MTIQHTPSQPSGGGTNHCLKPTAFRNHVLEAEGIELDDLDYEWTGQLLVLSVRRGGANAHGFYFVALGFDADHHVRATRS